MTKRDTLPDIIKSFAIFLVVLGHCLQELNGALYSQSMAYYDNKLYQFIYSFHMPLFAIIAGYYAFRSLNKLSEEAFSKKLSLLLRRSLTYIIPIFVWTLLEYIREIYINITNGYITYTASTLISGFFMKFIGNHWFLWAMVICFFVVWFSNAVLHNNIILCTVYYTALLIAFFFIPDGMNLGAYKYMITHYLPGYLFAMYSINGSSENLLKKIYAHPVITTVVSGVFFVILYLFYTPDAFIYVSGFRINRGMPQDWLSILGTDVYRFAIGISGSIFIIAAFKLISNFISNLISDLIPRLISRLIKKDSNTDEMKSKIDAVLSLSGKYSLGIYLISGYIIILGVKPFTDMSEYSLPRTLLIAMLVTLLSLLVSFIISKVKYLCKIIGK